MLTHRRAERLVDSVATSGLSIPNSTKALLRVGRLTSAIDLDFFQICPNRPHTWSTARLLSLLSPRRECAAAYKHLLTCAQLDAQSKYATTPFHRRQQSSRPACIASDVANRDVLFVTMKPSPQRVVSSRSNIAALARAMKRAFGVRQMNFVQSPRGLSRTAPERLVS